MRYLSLIIIVAVLIITWKSANSQSVKNLQTHVSIQEDISSVIAESLINYLPKAKNLKFNRLYTQALNDHEIMVSFSYSFQNEENGQWVDVSLDGKALVKKIFESEKPLAEGELNKNTTPNNRPTDSWLIDAIQLASESIEFSEAVIITPEGNSTEKKSE